MAVYGPGGTRFQLWRLPDQVSGVSCVNLLGQELCNATATAATQLNQGGVVEQLQLVAAVLGAPSIRSDTWMEAFYTAPTSAGSDNPITVDYYAWTYLNPSGIGVTAGVAQGAQQEFLAGAATYLESPGLNINLIPPPIVPSEGASDAEMSQDAGEYIQPASDDLAANQQNWESEFRTLYDVSEMAHKVQTTLEGLKIASGHSETDSPSATHCQWSGDISGGSGQLFAIDAGAFSALDGVVTTAVSSVRTVGMLVVREGASGSSGASGWQCSP
jgi:hypothetical protein